MYKPTTAKIEPRVHQFVKKMLEGTFKGFVECAGGRIIRRVLTADLEARKLLFHRNPSQKFKHEMLINVVHEAFLVRSGEVSLYDCPLDWNPMPHEIESTEEHKTLRI